MGACSPPALQRLQSKMADGVWSLNCVKVGIVRLPAQMLMTAPHTPSIHHPDILQPYSGHLPHIFLTPSGHLLDTFKTTFRHLTYTFHTPSRPFQTSSRHLPCTFHAHSRHLLDKTPFRHLLTAFQTPSGCLKDTF